MLFGTNLSNELFEFAKAVKASTRDLKGLLEKNVDAIFASDDETKEWLRDKITKFPVYDDWVKIFKCSDTAIIEVDNVWYINKRITNNLI